MRRQLLIILASILTSATVSVAQPPPGVPLGTSGNGFGQSPPSNALNYLNINRGGATPGINYYSLVRPFSTIQNTAIACAQPSQSDQPSHRTGVTQPTLSAA